MVFKDNFVISVKANGKILREWDSTVRLPFGSEYSLLLKNLNTRKALVKVTVDGREAISDLIVRPNDTVELERFFEGNSEKGHRFKFIEKNEDVRNFRGDYVEDGIIRVEYQFEKPQPEPIYRTVYREYIPYREPWPWERRCIPWWEHHPTIWSDGTNTSDYTVTDNVQNISCNINSDVQNKVRGLNPTLSSHQNEEGITAEGSESNQKFVHGNIGILENNSYVITLQLKGYTGEEKVEKPLTVKDKLQCKYCGTKWKSNHKYCGNCGAGLMN